MTEESTPESSGETGGRALDLTGPDLPMPPSVDLVRRGGDTAPAEPTVHVQMGGDRSLGVIFLRRSWIVVLGAIIVSALAYVVSNSISPSYASTAKVAVLVSGNDAADSTLGANNLASQYAEQVSGTRVVAAANKALGSLGPIPVNAVSGGTIDAQNIVQVKVNASSASLAQTRTAAVAKAFIAYLTEQVDDQELAFRASASREIAPLNAQIAADNRKLARGKLTAIQQSSLLSTLSTLVATRASTESSISENVSVGRPTFTLTQTAQPGSQTAPKPTLSAIIAFILAFLVFTRLVTLIGVSGRKGRSLSLGGAES